jgi:hypothetical protein
LGVFEFILLIVLITTVGKIVEARVHRPSAPALPPRGPGGEELEEMVGDLNKRLLRLEEERDFYRALLEPPERGGKGGSVGPGADPEPSSDP